jgi:hypothetical protein
MIQIETKQNGTREWCGGMILFLREVGYCTNFLGWPRPNSGNMSSVLAVEK